MASADEYAGWIVQNQSKKGTPDFDLVAKAYEEAKVEEAKTLDSSTSIMNPRKPPSTLDVITSAPYKAIAGTADLFLTAPQNVANLARMAYGTAVRATGQPELAPIVTAPRQPVTEFFKEKGLIQPTENMTTGQRILDVGLQTATGGALSPAASGREMLASGIKGLVGGAAGQSTTELTGSPAAGLAVSMTTPAAITSAAQAKQAQLQAQQARNAVRDLTIRAGQAENYVITPGSVTPSARNVLLERIGGKTRTQQEAAVLNQQTTDRLARRSLSLPEDAPLTRANMQEIRRDEYTKGYAPINNIGAVNTDQNFGSALDNVLAAYTGPGQSFPGAIPQPVKELVANYRVNQFNSADAIGATRTLRESARANMARGDNELGLAQRAISNALEDQIERSIQATQNPNTQAMLDQFRASRQRMAISHAVEDAIVEGGGSVNARQLANDLQTRQKYFSGDLDLIARFANIARPVMTPPGTTGTPGAGTMLGNPSFGNFLGSALGAGGGAMIGGVQGAAMGSTAGFVGPSVASFLARQYLLSPTGQQRAFSTNAPGVNLMATPASSNALSTILRAAPIVNNQNALAR